MCESSMFVCNVFWTKFQTVSRWFWTVFFFIFLVYLRFAVAHNHIKTLNLIRNYVWFVALLIVFTCTFTIRMNQIRLFINQRETIALKIIIQRVWRLIAPSRLICAYFETNCCVQSGWICHYKPFVELMLNSEPLWQKYDNCPDEFNAHLTQSHYICLKCTFWQTKTFSADKFSIKWFQ